MKSNVVTEQSSFRDPSGQIFYKEGRVLRQVNKSFADEFELLIKSGLYERLVADGLLLAFKRVSRKLALNNEAYCVLETAKVPFISSSYP